LPSEALAKDGPWCLHTSPCPLQRGTNCIGEDRHRFSSQHVSFKLMAAFQIEKSYPPLEGAGGGESWHATNFYLLSSAGRGFAQGGAVNSIEIQPLTLLS